jgi:hypothetical protein
MIKQPWMKSIFFQEMLITQNRTSFHLIQNITSAFNAVFSIRTPTNKETIKKMTVLPNYTIKNQSKVLHQNTFATAKTASGLHNAKKNASYANPMLKTTDPTNATQIAFLLN